MIDFTLSCGSRDADDGQAGAIGGQSLTLPAKEGRWRDARSGNDRYLMYDPQPTTEASDA